MQYLGYTYTKNYLLFIKISRVSLILITFSAAVYTVAKEAGKCSLWCDRCIYNYTTVG